MLTPPLETCLSNGEGVSDNPTACGATTGGDANGSPSPSAADPTFLDLAHVALSPHLDEYLTPTSITRSVDPFDPWDPDVQLPYGFDVDPDLEIA